MDEFTRGALRMHILHHASEEDIHGAWMSGGVTMQRVDVPHHAFIRWINVPLLALAILIAALVTVQLAKDRNRPHLPR